jgi:hypothetical protein
MQRTLATLSLTILLAACGSSSDDSNNPAGLTGHDTDGADARDHDTVTKPRHEGLKRGQAVFTGDAAASMFTPVEAVFAEGMFAGMAPGLMVAIGDKVDACSRLSNYSVPRDSRFLGFGVYNNEFTAPGAATYDSPLRDPANVLVTQFYQFDENCSSNAPKGKFIVAADGQMELTSVVHGETATGTFKIVLEEGTEPLVGEFHAIYCDAHAILEASGLSDAACAD